MKIETSKKTHSTPAFDVHLSYCTNIHPGESWSHLFPQLRNHLPQIKAAVSPQKPMGVGLRLSALAANELLEEPNLLSEFKDWLTTQDLYVYTINGFPFGNFHATVEHKKVKENVYEPDWSTVERLEYTKNLAEILAQLLPENVHGSISTVPVGFKAKLTKDSVQRAAKHLLQYADFAKSLEERSGKVIQLALEPEPSCYLEKIQDVVNFFSDYISSSESTTTNNTQKYLGVCLDTCHSTVMFEDPEDFAKAMRKASIPIYKIQLTAALKIKSWDQTHYDTLKPYAEPTYLHQTSIKNPATGTVRFFLDLDEALSSVQDGEELRSHFHVPVFAENLLAVSTTQKELINFLMDYRQSPYCQHLEVETYTFDVLPDNLTCGTIGESISREISWVIDILSAKQHTSE